MRSLLRYSPLFTAVLWLPLAATQSSAQATRAIGTPGYSAVAPTAQRRLEQEAIEGPVPARAKAQSAALSREPHVAGTPVQKRTADYVIAEMKAMGLETELRQYDVWLPNATSVKITRLGGTPLALDLSEPAIPGDPATAMKQYLTVNGSSGAGLVEGELVFVNYGLIEDYATLDSLGVSVKGKVALARYGRSFRGIKAREAEKRGAVATLIYTDPADDGFARGDVYLEGPMRPMRGVQRGSVFNGAGTYHSAYDTFAWMERFGDPGFVYHATASRIGAAMALRVANAEILPYDYVEFARTMRRYLAPLSRSLTAKSWDRTAIAALAAGISRLERSAQDFAGTRDSELTRGVGRSAQLVTNTGLLKVERAFARASGLKRRSWYWSLIDVADIDNGYANMNCPDVNEAIRAGDRATTLSELADLTQRFGAAADIIDHAAKLITVK